MDFGNTVSIGKFPLDYTEQQVLDIAKSAGPILSLKLLFDELTGKSKGYATITYEDQETAASAVRNLDYMTLPNGRFLRCTYSMDFVTGAGSKDDRLPPLPLGIQISQNMNAPQVISNVLNNIDSQSALQILGEIKNMSIDNPGLTKVLLDKFPQLSHALVELSLLSNTTNRDLIEHALNKRQAPLNEITRDHATLLNEINLLTDDDLENLDAAKLEVIQEIKKEIANGAYGAIATAN